MKIKLSKEATECNECNKAVNYKSVVKGKKITKIYELKTNTFVMYLCPECLEKIKLAMIRMKIK